ncbi:putative PAP1-poly(A) polymerase [Serendipita vermifera]|nr:putative PAP1-poly(A) polymerase [Serendipita vermifera]
MAQTTDQSEKYGVTPPISKEGPSQQEIALASDLINELRARGSFESEEESKKREAVLGHVAKLVKEFVYKTSIRRNFTEGTARASGGKIFTFGSYRLGVHGPGSDLDTLVVAPKHVDRQDFHEIFLEMLQNDPMVDEAIGVPEAYVPIIAAVIQGIPIDFTFARLALAVIPDDLELKDDSLLKNLDEKCVRSLNGSRCTDDILRLVPNVHVFRDALRAIKYWAQSTSSSNLFRAVYSNVNGFLGGVAWALLVARVCQLYPNGNSATIVRRFFLIMSMWKWPQPVLLRKIEDGTLNMRVWNPKLYQGDRAHKMPIITPAYPSMCSTHNVMNCTLEIMKEELKRGHEICTRIAAGEATWSDLFEKHNFFSRYHYYLQVIASSSEQLEHSKWAAAVESKVRQLVGKMETIETLARVHPFTKGFERTYYTTNLQEHADVLVGTIPPNVANRTEEEAKALQTEESQTIYTTTYYIGLEIARPVLPNGTVDHGPRKLDISAPTSEFMKLARSWESFVPETMGIAVRHIKNSALPDNVFEGAGRPRKSVKRVKTTKANAEGDESSANKRRRVSRFDEQFPHFNRPSDEAAPPSVDQKSLVPPTLKSIPSSDFAQPGPPRTPQPEDTPKPVNGGPNATLPSDGLTIPATNGDKQPKL